MVVKSSGPERASIVIIKECTTPFCYITQSTQVVACKDGSAVPEAAVNLRKQDDGVETNFLPGSNKMLSL